MVLKDSETNEAILGTGLPADKHKTLGHWNAPADTQTKLWHAIITKTKKISYQTSTSPVTRYGAKLGYNGIYIAGLRYALPQCHFNPRQLRRVECKSMSPLIVKCGFVRTSVTAFMYLPSEYAGGDSCTGTHYRKKDRSSIS